MKKHRTTDLRRAVRTAFVSLALAPVVTLALAPVVTLAQGQAADRGGAAQLAERVAAFKQALQENEGRLRRYEWVETTVISLKGEEKARTQKRCYHGADGKVQKIPTSEPKQQAPAQGGGRRGARVKQTIVENKKNEMQEYMERAGNLIHLYVPPIAPQIQAAKDAGKLQMVQPSPGQVRLQIPGYVQPGDLFTIDLDGAQNRVLGLNVNSYLETKDDPVTFDVRMSTLADGTSYPAQTTLEAKAKNIRVVVQNSGYRPM